LNNVKFCIIFTLLILKSKTMNSFYQNYTVTFTPNYVLSDFIKEYELRDAEIVQMFQEGNINGNFKYQIIFKIPVLYPKQISKKLEQIKK
jgi:hypothetical protein